MSDPKTRSGTTVRAFYDVGTDRVYDADEAVTLDAGIYANYLAAGLVTDPDATADEASPAPVVS